MEVTYDDAGTCIVFPNADDPSENDAEITVVINEGSREVCLELSTCDEYCGLILDKEGIEALIEALNRAKAVM